MAIRHQPRNIGKGAGDSAAPPYVPPRSISIGPWLLAVPVTITPEEVWQLALAGLGLYITHEQDPDRQVIRVYRYDGRPRPPLADDDDDDDDPPPGKSRPRPRRRFLQFVA